MRDLHNPCPICVDVGCLVSLFFNVQPQAEVEGVVSGDCGAKSACWRPASRAQSLPCAPALRAAGILNLIS